MTNTNTKAVALPALTEQEAVTLSAGLVAYQSVKDNQRGASIAPLTACLMPLADASRIVDTYAAANASDAGVVASDRKIMDRLNEDDGADWKQTTFARAMKIGRYMQSHNPEETIEAFSDAVWTATKQSAAKGEQPKEYRNDVTRERLAQWMSDRKASDKQKLTWAGTEGGVVMTKEAKALRSMTPADRAAAAITGEVKYKDAFGKRFEPETIEAMAEDDTFDHSGKTLDELKEEANSILATIVVREIAAAAKAKEKVDTIAAATEGENALTEEEIKAALAAAMSAKQLTLV